MTSGEYWEKRAIERALRLERGTLPYIRKLASLYARAYRSLREDLDRLFERYVETGDFSPEEAAAYLKEPVTPKERKILEDALKGITDEDERRKAVARINSASYRARMDRLRAMQERIRIECAKTAPDVIDTIRQAMERSGREAYYRTIFDNSKAAGVQLPFTDLSLERLEGVINQTIEGKSFSSRVWGNTNAVAQLLTDTLKENVATGRSWRRSVSDMRELLGVDYPGGATYAATRILRTETARVNNELSAEANVENGFDRYRYVAMLDSKTSEACRDHDGGIDPDTKKPYTYKNKKIGVNFPPLHPNCRSTTCAWVSEELLAKITRSAKDENGNVYQIPGNMTYREWEKARRDGAFDEANELSIGQLNRFSALSGDLKEKTQQLNYMLDSYGFRRKSRWNGNVDIVPKDKMIGARGRTNIDGNIQLREDAETKTVIHELLHTRSYVYFGKNLGIEEGTVELLSQAICEANNIPFTGAYPTYVDALKNIYKRSVKWPSLFEFSKELFDLDYEGRYNLIRPFAKAEELTILGAD